VIAVEAPAATGAGEDTRGVARIGPGAGEPAPHDGRSRLAIERERGVHDRAVDELLRAGGIDALAVVEDFVLPDPDAGPLIDAEVELKREEAERT